MLINLIFITKKTNYAYLLINGISNILYFFNVSRETLWKSTPSLLFMFHVKHGCEIMIYGDVIQKLIMNESIIDDNKLNLAFYKLTE